ncbi:MAG: hypothetical protein Q9192_004904 [Flavoplaca navasiana]
MAHIHDLPQELIELIFFESLNVSLPKASLRLGKLLSSSKTKNDLVMMAFPSTVAIWAWWDGRTRKNLPLAMAHYNELSCKLWTGDESSVEKEIGKLQHDILSCRWMTWDYLKQYFEISITRTILHEFSEQNLRWYDGKPLSDSLVRDFVHDAVYQDIAVGNISQYKDGLDHDPPITKEEWKRWEKQQTAKSRESVSYRENIKRALLNGKHVNSIHPLSSLEAGSSRTETGHGLMDAIRDDNHRAVDMLAAVGCDEQYVDPHRMDGMYAEPSLSEATFSLSSVSEDTDAYVRIPHLERRTVGVVPTTEHLKVAVIEKGCRKMIVRRLLFAQGAEIDTEDLSMKGWLLARTEMGDSKAGWLQYQMETSVELQAQKLAEGSDND